ncbi:MAG: hypothetical protein O8C67_15240 [Candidatus Methanoperedens sp.]|nr:hypothetical protein [Candidatus Methanoperedens sp.]
MSEGARISAKILEAKKEKKVLQTRRDNQSMSTPIDRIMFLQRTIGNQAVQRLFSSGALMPKTGECARRRNERPKLQHETDSLQHAKARQVQADPNFQMHILNQLPSDEEEGIEYSSDGLRALLAGSGTCQNGGGDSNCDPVKGEFKIMANNNTCCTKDCTQQHEQKHVDDVTGWGCCKSLSVAWNAVGANRSELAKKYNEWASKAEPITECNAYTNDVKCADALAKTKDCTGAGKDTDCCKDIEDYRTKYSALAKSYCAKAPKAAPPCPSY